jgi:hypothetical protein
MCTTSSAAGHALVRPRWSRLYGAASWPMIALALVEVGRPPEPLRTVLRYALVLVAVGGMALWVRSNRAAFDLQQWCTCAGETITVRVIESRPLAPTDARWPEPRPGRAEEHPEPALVPSA